MTKTIGRIAREGKIHIGDASISIWEDGLMPCMTYDERDAWELKFKREVFARVVQTMNRIGWTLQIPEQYVKQYGMRFARDRRECSKGDLKGWLEIAGRTVKLEMWQGVNTPTRPDHGGRYESNKEEIAPYLLRLEMNRTRRRIRDYLLGVFTGYEVSPDRYPKMGLMGITALEKAHHNSMTSGHYKPELGRAEISMASNAIALDGGTIEHGARVWALDDKGRVITGTAFYGLNNRWYIVTGKYGLTSCGTESIFTQPPEALRVKRNERERRGRLEREMAKAVKAMDFRRAELLRDLIFPRDAKLYVIRHYKDDCWWAPNACGYRSQMVDAGRYTEAEAKRILGPNLKSSRGDHAVLITNQPDQK